MFAGKEVVDPACGNRTPAWDCMGKGDARGPVHGAAGPACVDKMADPGPVCRVVVGALVDRTAGPGAGDKVDAAYFGERSVEMETVAPDWKKREQAFRALLPGQPPGNLQLKKKRRRWDSKWHRPGRRCRTVCMAS